MKKYVILDIDRTIINGTSWYHACSCPNLLIDEYNIDRFKELNNKMYVHGTSKDRYEFRKQTFELINKRVSESAYRKLSECGCADEILIGQNVNEVFFEAVGIYTYKKLMKSDEDCKKIVDFIYKYYFGDIEFIFLTSGYEPFMKGLVKEYMKSFHKNCTWRTIGSTIKFSNGCIYLKEVMTQEKKFQFVKKIIDYGNRVVFLADDSVEEKELFSVVFRNGGYAFNVRYDEKLHESNWHELINDIEDENVFLSYLMKNSEVALSDCKKVQNNFFRLHMNEIGVICLNDIEYHGIKVEYYPNLPVPDYEIESIRYMVRCLPDGVMPILIIENKLSVEDIMKVINIYGLNVFKCGIQMQFRTNIEYINKIIEMGFERVIVAVGLMQKDVKEYLEFVDKALRTSKDLILLDMSRHQPHVIVNEKVIDKYDVSFETKYNCLNRIVSCLKKLETSVLLADDIMPDKMILCQLMLLSQGVNIIGLDMQNNIEVDKTEQKYCKIKENKTSKYHYAKIRKSVEKIKKWNIFE